MNYNNPNARFTFNKKQHDIGMKTEEKLRPYLDVFFNTTFEKRSENIYDKLDFWDGKNLIVEVKGRTNSKNQYPTTFITVGKVEAGFLAFEDNPDLDVYFFFVFTDKTSYVKLSRDKPTWRKANAGTNWIPHYFIPVDELIDFERVLNKI